jgi:hypothetical protein
MTHCLTGNGRSVRVDFQNPSKYLLTAVRFELGYTYLHLTTVGMVDQARWNRAVLRRMPPMTPPLAYDLADRICALQASDEFTQQTMGMEPMEFPPAPRPPQRRLRPHRSMIRATLPRPSRTQRPWSCSRPPRPTFVRRIASPVKMARKPTNPCRRRWRTCGGQMRRSMSRRFSRSIEHDELNSRNSLATMLFE